MDGESKGAAGGRDGGFLPLVPPPRGAEAGPPDPMALHRHGVELLAAANRLAIAWMREAAAQHAAITGRMLDEVTETARRLASAERADDQVRAMLDGLAAARANGLATAQEIAGLMARIQGDALSLLRQAALPPRAGHDE
jgi:hypothetical protein